MGGGFLGVVCWVCLGLGGWNGLTGCWVRVWICGWLDLLGGVVGRIGGVGGRHGGSCQRGERAEGLRCECRIRDAESETVVV